ncbi:uncharacterized protein LOC103978967 isoform X1 [Musa acuminata AAA Group]|uniref:uncharacterized protein LOC103978967 isoform X1 n=1 Tax=Musa acuminata AAA Group TaxID=214697 RepID=UPI0031E496F2
MQNEAGEMTDLYIPRKCSATNRLITAKDHASVQINIGHLDESGVYTGQFTTFALSGFIRAQIFYVLDPNLQPIPDPTDDDTDEIKAEQKKRNEDEVMCRGHILNALSDRLYDLYTVEPSAKAIWNALEFKYHAEEEG